MSAVVVKNKSILSYYLIESTKIYNCAHSIRVSDPQIGFATTMYINVYMIFIICAFLFIFRIIPISMRHAWLGLLNLIAIIT